MNFSFDEVPNSRAQTFNPPQKTLVYKAVGEQNDAFVSSYALSATAPVIFSATLGTLYRQDIRIDPDGFAQYVVTVPYAPRAQQPPSRLPTGSRNFTFDTTGATIHIQAAKAHVQSYDSGGLAADLYKAAIGYNRVDGSVEGADIVAPALKLSVNFRHPLAVVTIPFVRSLRRVTGRTNLHPFLSHEIGELLFLGANGSDGTESDADVGYHFLSNDNETGLSVGDIVGIAKQGHHLVWVEFKDAVAGGQAAAQPLRVHVERCYDPVDFAAVFGWS